MIYASDFRKGRTFQINGEPHVVLDFLHVKPGKGAAFVRTKYKNIITGATREEAFNPDDKFEEAIIETKKMQYLYDMDGLYYFMDPETYDQIPLGAEQVEDAIKFMRPNDEATVKFFQGNAFLVEAPNFVDLEVIETRAGREGQHRNQRNEGRNCRNRCSGTGSDLHRNRRKDPDRHQNRRISGKSEIVDTKA